MKNRIGLCANEALEPLNDRRMIVEWEDANDRQAEVLTGIRIIGKSVAVSGFSAAGPAKSKAERPLSLHESFEIYQF